jgi:Zn-dependent metalloprotease
VLGKDPQPGHLRDYVELPHDGDHDNGGVHVNSGIPNRAFYTLAVELGGAAWERAGRIWFDTLTARGVPRDVDFAGFAALTVKAVEKRYGPGSTEAAAVPAACAEVGVAVSG